MHPHGSHMGPVFFFLSSIYEYGLYMFLAVVVTAFIGHMYANRTMNSIIDDFFKYVKKGRKRTLRIRRNIEAFMTIQVLGLVLAFFVGFYIYVIACLASFYAYAMYTDKVKEHRHNGVAIGYEYPHPANIKEEKSLVTAEGKERISTRLIEAGSKGVYDIQLKSEPNPHVAVIGESGTGKSSTVEAFLLGTYKKYKIPFLIIDWSGSYKNFEGYVNVWHVPNNLKVDPLALRSKTPDRRSGIASEVLQLSLGLTDLQTQKVMDMLFDFYLQKHEPTIQELYEKTLEEAEVEKLRDIKTHLRYIANRLRQGFEVFGYEPEMFWDNYDKTCNVIELEGLTDLEKNLVTQSILQRVIESFKVTGDIKLYIALDDAYQAVKNTYVKETPITRIVREGRKYGFVLVIATQLLQDLPDPIIGNTSLKFIGSYHEPEGVGKITKMLKLTPLEEHILYRMPVGACFLFDQNAIHNGKAYPSYVQIDRITEHDKHELKESIKGLEIGTVKSTEFATPVKPSRGLHKVIREIDMPSVSVYRFLVAFYRTKQLTEAYKTLRSKKWITSLTTLYGDKSKPSILARAVDGGYIKDSKHTQKALKLLDQVEMVMQQRVNRGSEEHVGLMKRTIEMIQDNGNFPFVLDEREAFDVGEVRVDGKVKGLWDYKNVVAYEIQTNAIKSEIFRCIEKAKEQQTELVFVTNSAKTKEEIERLTDSKYLCLKLSIDEQR